MAANHNVAQFFKNFNVQDASIRILVGYDSMCSEAQTLNQGSMMRSILETWDFPNLSDGTPPWVSIGVQGPSTFARTVHSYDLSSHGWTKTNNKAPGGAAADSGQGIGGPASGGENGVSPNPYSDWTIATGAARTAYVADGNSAGVAFQVGVWNPPPSGGTGRTFGFNSFPDAFAGRQCHARMLYTKNTAGPTDMRIQGMRQLWSTSTMSTNNTGYVGSKDTVDMSGSTYAAVDVDCGTGEGSPGFVLINPNSPTGASTLRMYITGCRVFRSTGGLPLTSGVQIATLAQGANSDVHQASLLGVADMTTGQSNVNARTPNPYVSAANARTYISNLVGGSTGPTSYPNRIIIYTGHNLSNAEVTELASGQSATMLAAIGGIMAQHTANATALGSEAPRFLILSCEKFYSGYSTTIRDNKRNTLRAAAVAFGATASFMDLYDYTNDGTADDTAMWYCRHNAGRAIAGSGSGPVIDSSPDRVHNSYAGANYIARLVWELGMESLGLSVGLLRGNRSQIPQASSGGRRRAWTR